MVGTGVGRRTGLWVAVLWALALAGFIALSAQWSSERMRAEVDEAGRTLHRTLSQSAAQHDAHLTSLGALAIASDPPPLAQFEQVAASIVRFYPRILSIRLLDAAGDSLVSVGAVEANEPQLPQLGTLEPGRVVMLPGYGDGHFRLLKRTSDPAGKMAVLMDIDAAGMFDADLLPVWAAAVLVADDGSVIAAFPGGVVPTETDLSFEKVLASDSQPMLLLMSRKLSPRDFLTPGPILLFGAGSLAIAVLALMLIGQRQRAREAIEAAGIAEARERLQAHEVRLTHASRVNAMGEMASGIAHELTQPLTALLSQSQAGLRMIDTEMDNQPGLRRVLEANARQAKRAGDILARLRAYVSKAPPQTMLIDVNDVVSDIGTLMQADLVSGGCELRVDLLEPARMVLVDPVQLEQVVHNLIRNAAEAMAGRGGVIGVAISASAGKVQIAVSDAGPGIGDEAMPRLFEPFYSTKPEGMGLGLSLCQSLIERFGGHIEARNRPVGGAEFVVTLPLADVMGVE